MTVYAPALLQSEWVRLSPYEFRLACLVGKWIWQDSQADGREDRDGWRGFEGNGGWRRQALGSLCEQIAAKTLDVHWACPVNNFSSPDLPHNIEVRLIGREHYGLRVYPRTDDSRRVVGVVIPPGQERSHHYRVAGWYVAGEAKRDEWQMAPHGRPPMFCVPQDHLRPIAELRRLIAEEKLA